MNKYLFKKIEQAHSAYFENLIFIANEVCREKQSESFEEFTELEPIEIAKILGWNEKESTLKMIEESVKEKEFSTLLLQNDITGFIAECHLPHHSKFMFNDGEERPWGSSVHCGTLRVAWVYAESIGELVEKLEEKADKLYIESYEKEKLKVSSSVDSNQAEA
jgi:hypothetical protein